VSNPKYSHKSPTCARCGERNPQASYLGLGDCNWCWPCVFVAIRRLREIEDKALSASDNAVEVEAVEVEVEVENVPSSS